MATVRPSPATPRVHWHEGGAGPVLLLLNGWAASGLLWPSDWLRRLERRFHVVRVDNRGTGWSRGADAPFTIADMAEDAADVLRALGADRATVLGLSMGGMIAQELGLRHPGRVDRLVVVASRPPAPEHVDADPWLLPQVLSRPARGEPLADYFRRLWSAFCAPGFARSHPERVDELVGQILERPTPRSGVLNQLRAIAAWSGADRLRSLAPPTLVVHGEADPLMPVRNGMRIAQLVPHAGYRELPGVGHLVPLEAGDGLAELVEELAAET